MAVIITQPGVVVTQQSSGLLIGTKQGHRDWSSGLMACCDDCGAMMLTFCCHEYVVCDISTRQGDCCLMPWCVPDALLAMRTRIRTLGGIQGTICNDCMALSCCYLCALCQMQRELNAMGL